MIKGLKNLSCEERLKDFDFFFFLPVEGSGEWREAYLFTVFQYLKGGYRENKGSLFTKSHIENTRDNVYKLHQKRFYFDMKNCSFIVRTIIHWNNLSRIMVESPSLEVLRK